MFSWSKAKWNAAAALGSIVFHGSVYFVVKTTLSGDIERKRRMAKKTTSNFSSDRTAKRPKKPKSTNPSILILPFLKCLFYLQWKKNVEFYFLFGFSAAFLVSAGSEVRCSISFVLSEISGRNGHWKCSFYYKIAMPVFHSIFCSIFFSSYRAN